MELPLLGICSEVLSIELLGLLQVIGIELFGGIIVGDGHGRNHDCSERQEGLFNPEQVDKTKEQSISNCDWSHIKSHKVAINYPVLIRALTHSQSVRYYF